MAGSDELCKARKQKFLIIIERDVGLFSLIHQVINSLYLAQQHQLIPICYFTTACCYYVPEGYHNNHTVWEYYFEPLDPMFDEQTLLQLNNVQRSLFMANHIVTHEYKPRISGNSAKISVPFLSDPTPAMRRSINRMIDQKIHLKARIRDKVDCFWQQSLDADFTIGVHIRGTDAIDHSLRQQNVNIEEYISLIHRVIRIKNEAGVKKIKVFIASDDQKSINDIREACSIECISYPAIRKNITSSMNSGRGPTGEIMPAFLTENALKAAQSGEDALVECYLLARCDLFIHNISSLARTVLLLNPSLESVNLRAKDYPRIRQLLAEAKARA